MLCSIMLYYPYKNIILHIPISSTVDCTWDYWSVWTACSVICGTGTQERSRNITQEAFNGGEDCRGNETEIRACIGDCPGKLKYLKIK